MPFGIPSNSALGQLADRIFGRHEQQQAQPAPTSSGATAGAQGTSDGSYVSATGEVVNPNTVDTSKFEPATSTAETGSQPQAGSSSSTTQQPQAGSPSSTTQQAQSPREQELASLFQEAHTAWALYDFGTVIRDLKAIDALAPGDPETKRLLGVSYFNLARQQEEKGNLQDAKQNYEAALQIEPDNAEYRGWYNQLNGKMQKS